MNKCFLYFVVVSLALVTSRGDLNIEFVSAASAQSNSQTSSTETSDESDSVLEKLLNQAVDLTKEVITYTSDQLIDLTDEIRKQIEYLDSPDPTSSIDIEDKIYRLRVVVDELTELKNQEQEAPGFALISLTKKDYRIKIDEVLEELEPVLFDGEVVDYAARIRNALERIKQLQMEKAKLTEEKIFGKPEERASYDKKIEDRQEAMDDLETLIQKLEVDLMKKFHRLGVDMSISQVRVLTRRVDGDDLGHTLAVFDVTKQISRKMAELMTATKFEPEFTKKYYGIYVVMAEMILYSQRIYLEKINKIYLPALDVIQNDIKKSIRFAEKSLRKQDNKGNREILKNNIESNKFSREVLDFYRKTLETQISHLRKAMESSRANADVAYSTYDTAAISGNLVNLIDTTQEEFNKVLEMQLPTIVPFTNQALEKRFTEITSRISGQK
jgi:tetratricopeptide (TPR) repeat protein